MSGIVTVLADQCRVLTFNGLTAEERESDYPDAHYSAAEVDAALARERTDYPNDQIADRLLTEPCATLECTGCGEDVDYGDYAITHWPASEIEQAARRCAWVELDGKWWCVNCTPDPARLAGALAPGPLDQPLF